ncbi:hypothetical protein BCR39DRAFT_574175, partial [Naematelia encephala]
PLFTTHPFHPTTLHRTTPLLHLTHFHPTTLQPPSTYITPQTKRTRMQTAQRVIRRVRSLMSTGGTDKGVKENDPRYPQQLTEDCQTLSHLGPEHVTARVAVEAMFQLLRKERSTYDSKSAGTQSVRLHPRRLVSALSHMNRQKSQPTTFFWRSAGNPQGYNASMSNVYSKALEEAQLRWISNNSNAQYAPSVFSAIAGAVQTLGHGEKETYLALYSFSRLSKKDRRSVIPPDILREFETGRNTEEQSSIPPGTATAGTSSGGMPAYVFAGTGARFGSSSTRSAVDPSYPSGLQRTYSNQH